MTPPFPRPLAGVLLDLDGTLVDTEPLHFTTTRDILAGYGVSFTMADFLPYVGWSEEPFWSDLGRRYRLPDPPAILVAERTRRLRALLRDRALEPMPGAEELLTLLAEVGLPAAVASSSPRQQIAAMLAASGLDRWIRHWRSGHEDVARGKPAPDVYLAAARDLGVAPGSCLAVEDSGTGVQSARAAGCFVVGIPCPSHPDEAGLAAADLRLDSLAELPPLLRAHLHGAA